MKNKDSPRFFGHQEQAGELPLEGMGGILEGWDSRGVPLTGHERAAVRSPSRRSWTAGPGREQLGP